MGSLVILWLSLSGERFTLHMVNGGVGPFSPTTYVQLSKGHCLRSIMVNHRETEETIFYLFQASFTSISKTISWDENSTPRIPSTLVGNEGRFSEWDFPNLPKKYVIHSLPSLKLTAKVHGKKAESQNESRSFVPTINFEGRAVSFREGS